MITLRWAPPRSCAAFAVKVSQYLGVSAGLSLFAHSTFKVPSIISASARPSRRARGNGSYAVASASVTTDIPISPLGNRSKTSYSRSIWSLRRMPISGGAYRIQSGVIEPGKKKPSRREVIRVISFSIRIVALALARATVTSS